MDHRSPVIPRPVAGWARRRPEHSRERRSHGRCIAHADRAATSPADAREPCSRDGNGGRPRCDTGSIVLTSQGRVVLQPPAMSLLVCHERKSQTGHHARPDAWRSRRPAMIRSHFAGPTSSTQRSIEDALDARFETTRVHGHGHDHPTPRPATTPRRPSGAARLRTASRSARGSRRRVGGSGIPTRFPCRASPRRRGHRPIP